MAFKGLVQSAQAEWIIFCLSLSALTSLSSSNLGGYFLYTYDLESPILGIECLLPSIL